MQVRCTYHEPALTGRLRGALAIAGEHTQRAASAADYHLTGLITCPHCGHSYVGTSATSRTSTYRYYTCFSPARYGTHGCPAPRLPADQTDAAVLQALCDFDAHSTSLIQDAVTRAQQRHRDGHAGQHAEEPAPPPPGVIEDLQAHLADAIASGTPAERKAAIEALDAEVLPVRLRKSRPKRPAPMSRALSASSSQHLTRARQDGA